MGEVGAHCVPTSLVNSLRQALLDRRIGQLVDDSGIEPIEILVIEARRGAAEGAKIKAGDERSAVSQGLDRLRRTQPCQQRNDRFRFNPALAKGIAAERAKPLRRASCAKAGSAFAALYDAANAAAKSAVKI
jgi:hypothetical protein